MKIKNLFNMVLAGAMVFASCAKEQATFMDEIQLSSSYVVLSDEGGSATVTMTATEDWTFNFPIKKDYKKLTDEKGVVTEKVDSMQMECKENKWITVTPSEGKAGQNIKLTITVPANDGTRDAELRVKTANGKYHYINVKQLSNKPVPESTVKEVVKNGADGKTYKVSGTCSKIANVNYGNWYMVDEEGNELYIYGTVDGTGAYNWSKFNIAVGDKVTVEGPRTTYGSTIELVDAAFIKVEKALLESKDVNKTINKETNAFQVTITKKNTESDLHFESASDWMTVSNGYNTDAKGNLVFDVTCSANDADANRTGSLKFTSVLKETVNGKEKETKTILNLSITQLATVEGSTGNGIKAIADAITPGTSKAPILFDAIVENAVVTFVNGSNFYIEDKNGDGILLYDSSATYVAGDVINGRVWGKGYAYNGLPEATAFNSDLAKKTKTEKTPAPTEVEMAELLGNFSKYMSRYIVIKDAVLSEDVEVTTTKVVKAGALGTDAQKTALNITNITSFTGDYYKEGEEDPTSVSKQKVWYNFKAEKGQKMRLTCIPTYYKANQISVNKKDWFKLLDE